MEAIWVAAEMRAGGAYARFMLSQLRKWRKLRRRRMRRRRHDRLRVSGWSVVIDE